MPHSVLSLFLWNSLIITCIRGTDKLSTESKRDVGRRSNENAESKIRRSSRSNTASRGSHKEGGAASSNLNLNDNLVAHAGGICYDSAQCDDCYECNSLARCVPIAGCYISCYSDEDCVRTQFCNGNHVCEDDPIPCYDTSECPLPKLCDLDSYQCVNPTPSPTLPGCCAGNSEYTAIRCQLASDESHCNVMSSCSWISGEDADCDWMATETPNQSGCCMITVR